MSGQTPSGDGRVVASAEDWHLIEALRRGDDEAFMSLMELYYTSMLRIALMYVSDQATAEDVIQETWIGVLRGLDRFEGRSSLKTWIFTILTNRAKTRAQRESRYVPLSVLLDTETEGFEPAVSPERFNPPDQPKWASHWRPESMPRRWDVIPEDRLMAQETLAAIHDAINLLPSGQQQVIRLRDIEGWTSAEVCNALEISETNQRVLLHRARAKVRRALEDYMVN